MYSHEIQQLMEYKQYLLSVKEYLEAFNPSISSQISRLKYDDFTKEYECWTYDNYYWKFKIEREKKL